MKIGQRITHEGIEAELVEEETPGGCEGCCFNYTDEDCPTTGQFVTRTLCSKEDQGIFKQINKEDETKKNPGI